jgi:hypothetical protein
MKPIPATETLDRHVNQNGVTTGPRKLALFHKALTLRGVPKIYHQDGLGLAATAYVKLFDPASGWTWFITEWDGADNCFGLVIGHEAELGYMSLQELSRVRGRLGIGIEVDVHFLPQPLAEAKKTSATR